MRFHLLAMAPKLLLTAMCLTALPLLAQMCPAATTSPMQSAVDPNSRIDPHLQELYRQWFATRRLAPGARAAQLASAFPELSLAGGGETVLVRVTARDAAALRPALAARGFELVADRAKFHFLEGRLPLAQLAPGQAGLAALAPQGLLGVIPVFAPISNANTGANSVKLTPR